MNGPVMTLVGSTAPLTGTNSGFDRNVILIKFTFALRVNHSWGHCQFQVKLWTQTASS